MTVAEMMWLISFSTIDVIVITPVGRISCSFDADHVSEDEDMFYMEDSNGYPLVLKKDSEVKLENDGTFSIYGSDCLFCIKLNV